MRNGYAKQIHHLTLSTTKNSESSQYTTIAIVQNAGFVCRSSRNARGFPLTESWYGLACGAALNRIALDRPTSNRSRVLP